MEIYWKYIDKRMAAIKALQDWPYMQFILDHTDQEIKDVYESVSAPGRVRTEFRSPSRNVHAGEERIVGALERVGVLEHRYEEAVAYMNWFGPAWDALSEEDQLVLSEFYGKDHEYGDGVIDKLAEYFHIDRSSAYRRKNRAVEKLALLLYG